MKLIEFVNSHLGTGKGLLLFLLGLILIWLGGYYLIDFVYPDEWTRYLRQLYFSRFTLILALLCLISASIPHLKSLISTTKKTATDLAVFRILFFGFFAAGLIFNPNALSNQVLPFLELPDSAQMALPFMGWYPKVIPMNETVVSVVLLVFYLSIFTSLFGFKTRWSIVIFTITLFYLFTIPNLFGKVNHNHHLIWFPMILAFSPCADRFSIDAYFRKHSNKVIHHLPNNYSLPIILIWILMGLIYFFPGFWKMWSNGLDWCLTDNVRNQFYFKWLHLGGGWNSWTPFFRIDHYPVLYKASGLFTILFELSFLPLILNKTTRKFGILMGLFFHVGTLIFMKIFFIVLVLSYLTFVNWNKIPFLKEKGNLSSLSPSNKSHKTVKWIGVGLILCCVIFGFGKWNSWPFTVYPTFDSIVEVETNHLVFIGTETNGKKKELSNKAFYKEYSSERYSAIEYNIIQSINENKIDTTFLNHLLQLQLDAPIKLNSMEVYIEKTSIVPGKNIENQRQLIYSK